MAATKSSSSRRPAPLTDEEKRGITEAEFAWDLSIQVAALRDLRGISQAELVAFQKTKQQAISRLEDPEYQNHSLRTLREFASALNAYVDVVLVPQEQLAGYLAQRHQPVLQEHEGSSGAVTVEEHSEPVGVQIPRTITKTSQAGSLIFGKASVRHFGGESPI